MANILVIDDEESIRFTFSRFIRGAGHEVVAAETLAQGIQRVTRESFDLIFADILLGGETGIDILRLMRDHGVTSPLVFITAYPNVHTASEAVRLGAFDYLQKPVQKDTLLRVIKLALEHKRIMDENERYRANLEAILASVKDVIVTVDKDLMLLSYNRAAEECYGLSPQQSGKPFGLLATGCHGRCIEAIETAIRTKQPADLRRIECLRSDGQRRVVSLTASPLLDGKGGFAGAVMVARDETCLVDLERNLRERRQFHTLVGATERMQQIYALIEDLANVQTSVLITGESGTGKELLAEAIHYAGDRSEKPLVKVNCSALSETLLESELFGHVRGAFTGAIKDKVGRFQLADGGTIFLDEIGDVSLPVQQRLLRVLQEREFERVGDSSPSKVDVRVLAATNKNLRHQIKRGDFREDLYYRLKVVEITLPPLRERREDIPLLVEHFIKGFNSKFNKTIHAVSDDVLTLLMNHPWPGNVRQLSHAIEHAFILCRSHIITLEHLPPDIEDDMEPEFHRPSRNETADELEAILAALEKASWNKAKAARLLNISRRTIYRKMEEYGIKKEDDDSDL
ncbi:MAG: sigma 54-interacting transcriptional regulator [Syntrophobacteraceae bacterium]